MTTSHTVNLEQPLDERGARVMVAKAGQILYRVGLSEYLGHCSARSPQPGRIVVKPKHSPRIRGMNRLSGEHMVVVDLDGNLVEGEDRPPEEIYIHTEIYRARPDVNAIVHTHQTAATLMGIIDAPISPILHLESTFVDAPVPNWPCPLLVTSPEMGADLARTLGNNPYCHLQGHGIVSVAADMPAAVVGAIMLEQLAQANLAVLNTGRKPRLITADEIEKLKARKGPIAGRWAYLNELLDE